MILTTAHVAVARAFAISLHGDQMYGDKPYVVHLDAVVQALVEHGYTEPDLLIAALMHDVVEDTATTPDERELRRSQIAMRFGEEVADTVWRVSNFWGKDPADLQAHYYPKIRAHRAATLVKLANRLANIRASAHVMSKLVRYLDSHAAFVRGIYVPGLGENLWESLAAAVDGGYRLMHAQ